MKRFLIVFMVLAPFFMSAAIGNNGISVDSKGNQLKWEEGRWDFFIMHKSLVEKVSGEATTSDTNPQADTCIDQSIGSTYTLTSKHIPSDADIDRAFLVWLSTQNPDNLNGKTDNSVTLTFKNSLKPGITLSSEITASKQGNLATSQMGDFEYEALNIQDSNSGNTGIYTYRVEVSDFMKKIIKMGEDAGMNSGEALYGDYNVKGMECSNHQNYLTTSGLVGGWFMPIVYTSSKISAKKIYFYNGLSAYRFETKTITVQGFELPENAVIKLGLVVFEGDPGLASATGTSIAGSAAPEVLSVSGQSSPEDFAPLFNNCNPAKSQDSTGRAFNYTEIFNSISSVFGWEDSENYWCIGNPDNPSDTTNKIEYAIDADIMMVDTSPSGPFSGRFNKGDTEFNIKIGANQDQVYTNMLLVSVETQKSETDTGDTDNGNTDSGDSDSGDSDNADTDSADTDDQSDTVDSSDSGDQSSEKDDSENTDPKQGELHGACYSDGTCDAGLVCNSHNICKEEIKFSGCSALVF